MGLFGWIKKAASAVVSTAKKAATVAKKKLDEAVDYVSSLLADSVSKKKGYVGNTTKEIIDIDKELNKFNDLINPRAEEAEKAAITDAMEHFDAFAEDLQEAFPELVDVVRLRQKEARNDLTGTIMGYVKERVSANDETFLAVLKMQQGDEKKDRINKRIKTIIKGAKREFRTKLQEKLQNLSEELNERLKEKIEKEEEALNTINRKYTELERQASANVIDFGKLEDECAPVIEATACIRGLLEDEEE